MRVLITGASSGIGAALARAYAADGAEVWLAARREDRLSSEVAAIEGAGGKAHAVALDVGDVDALEGRLLQLDEQVGGFDIVVANAGVGGEGKLGSRTTWAESRQVFQVNLLGAVATLMAAQQPMLKRGRGQLVAVSSLAGVVPLPTALDYGTSKAALSFFCTGLAPDLRKRGVKLTLVEPGFIKSEMTDANDFPMPFMMDTEKAAAVLVKQIGRGAKLVRLPLAYRLLFIVVRLMPLWLVHRLALSSMNAPAAKE